MCFGSVHRRTLKKVTFLLQPRRIVASDWATSWVSIKAFLKALGEDLGALGPLGALGALKGPSRCCLIDGRAHDFWIVAFTASKPWSKHLVTWEVPSGFEHPRLYLIWKGRTINDHPKKRRGFSLAEPDEPAASAPAPGSVTQAPCEEMQDRS